MLEIHWLTSLLGLPEVGDVLFVALAHGALVIVAQALLCPEWALSFKVDLVGSEERGLLELAEDGRDSAIELLELFDWCARSIDVSLDDLCGTLGWVKIIRELFDEEV